jgi:hypothetical protein
VCRSNGRRSRSLNSRLLICDCTRTRVCTRVRFRDVSNDRGLNVAKRKQNRYAAQTLSFWLISYFGHTNDSFRTNPPILGLTVVSSWEVTNVATKPSNGLSALIGSTISILELLTIRETRRVGEFAVPYTTQSRLTAWASPRALALQSAA